MVEEHSVSLLQDSYFWLVVATTIFVFVAYKYGRKPLLDALDGRTNRIKSELEEAEKLRVEAQELLANYEHQHREAVKNAEEIMKHAEESSKRIQKEAASKLKEQLTRREEQLLERIERAEISAIEDVRNQAADIAISATQKLIETTLSKKGNGLVDQAIKDIPDTLH